MAAAHSFEPLQLLWHSGMVDLGCMCGTIAAVRTCTRRHCHTNLLARTLAVRTHSYVRKHTHTHYKLTRIAHTHMHTRTWAHTLSLGARTHTHNVLTG